MSASRIPGRRGGLLLLSTALCFVLAAPVWAQDQPASEEQEEIVVDAVKSAGRAPLIGVPTPGEVTTVGAVKRVGSDALLMLPGTRLALEGKPTQPDYLVPRELRYSAGADPQLESAELILLERITEVRGRVAPSPPRRRGSMPSRR